MPQGLPPTKNSSTVPVRRSGGSAVGVSSGAGVSSPLIGCSPSSPAVQAKSTANAATVMASATGENRRPAAADRPFRLVAGIIAAVERQQHGKRTALAHLARHADLA